MSAGWGLVVFDLDGTLVDTAPDIAFCANAVLKEEGLPERPKDAISAAIGLGVHELFKRLLGSKIPGDALERMVARFRDLYSEHLVKDSRPYAGVREALEGPLGGMTKAVVTNKPHPLSVRLLDELGLTRHFKRVIGMNGGFPAKPDPASTREVMQALGFAGGQTLFVGDSSVDQETARRAGADFAWVSYGYEARPQGGSFPVFDSPSQWKEIVNGNIRR